MIAIKGILSPFVFNERLWQRCDQRMKPFRFGIVEAVDLDAPSGIKVLPNSMNRKNLSVWILSALIIFYFHSLKFFRFLHFRFSVTFFEMLKYATKYSEEASTTHTEASSENTAKHWANVIVVDFL